MGVIQVERINEGMCRECAWDRIKLKCKICGEIIAKGYPKLLAHTIAHYSHSELLTTKKSKRILFL